MVEAKKLHVVAALRPSMFAIGPKIVCACVWCLVVCFCVFRGCLGNVILNLHVLDGFVCVVF